MPRKIIYSILAIFLVTLTSNALSSYAETAETDETGTEIVQRRFLTRYYDPRSLLTCDKFPKACHLKGSPGHNCCHKKCVNVKNDNFNCGGCGIKCKFGWRCCGGKCVSVMYDRSNCGACRNKCGKHGVCRYGMCSYAS